MNAPGTATPKRSPLRRALIWLGAILAVLLLIAALIAGWAWQNRYSLMERQAITYLGSIGIDADLRIGSADGTRADIRDIHLSQNGERFLSVDRLEAEYQWRDLLNGQVERLAFTRLDAVVTLDESGRIVDGWVPPTSGEGGQGFPARGISLQDSAVLLRTPFGDVPVSGDADIRSLSDLEFDGQLARTTLRRDSLAATLEGPLSLGRAGAELAVAAPDMQVVIDHPAATLRDSQLELDARYDLDTRYASGTSTLSGGQFEASAGIIGRIESVSVDGSWLDGTIQGVLDAELLDLSVMDAERRSQLARTLSLANALSEVPVAQNFAPGLVAPLSELLTRADLSASADLFLDRTRRTLTLREPMTVSGDGTELLLSPGPDDAFYTYVLGSGLYDIHTVATLSRPVPLTLEPLSVTIRTEDGLGVSGVAAASGTMQTRQSWRARTQGGRPARLGPLSVAFDYAAPVDAPSQLVLRGAADYDGDVPGGYVDGLRASGRLTTNLADGRTRVDFVPDRRLSFDRLETTSEWTVEDFSGQIVPRSPLYARTEGRPALVATDLSDATLRAVRAATDTVDAAALDLSIGTASLSGTVGTSRQDWQVAFESIGLTSDSFPVEGTDLSLPSGTLTVGLSGDARTDFALSAPTSELATPAYVVRGMSLEASGTAERYSLDFAGGRVRMIPQTEDAIPLPTLPASGTLIFADGRFSGRAQAALPNAPDNPFDIDYTLGPDGGEAKIAIRDLRFRPGGLQPQELIPTLRGKIARVTGAINADLSMRFGGDGPPNGTGTVEIVDMALGTAPGPVTGLSGTVELTSLFPVVTAPDQILFIDAFDPGFPLENGEVTYALITDGIAISRAVFPLGEGSVRFDPFTWTYGAEENRVVLRVSGVEIGDFLRDIGGGRLTVTGALEGTIPVVVRGIEVLVENGRIDVRGGGTIRYRSDDPNPNMALKALENFNYQALFAEVNGPLDGDVKLGLIFTGSNPDVLFAVPFQFDVTVEGELFNIARNLNPNGLQDRIVNTVTSEVTGTPSR
ncbi:MAG: YdbH domain-containing protein [Litorimonas sp.]